MLRILTSYSLRHRAVVIALLLVFVIAAAMAFRRLPIEAFPDVTNVSAQIITLFPGNAAEEVERLVTIPIENQMNSVPRRVSMRSISLFGLSQVTLVFDDSTDADYIRTQVLQALQSVNLPPGAQASLSPNATPVGEIFRYTLQGPKGLPPTELKALQDWVVERQIRTVPGIVDVVGFGGPIKQYQVLVDPMKLKSYNIPLKQVFDALSAGNRNAGGSYVEHGSEMYVVRGLGYIRSVEDISNIAVATRSGTPLRIRDIGCATIGNQIRLGRVGKSVSTTSDNDDSIQGIVLMRRGGNALEVLELVKQKIAEVNASFLPPGVRVVPHYDRTELIERTLRTVQHNMVEGIALVVLVLMLFLGLGNYRSALVVAAVVPFSLLGAFFLLDLKGIPANLISMGAIDFGIIVDSAVVVIENLLHRLEQQQKTLRDSSLTATILDSVSEMGRPILFSKAILLIAFVPLFTLQRVEGRIFRPMALTLTFALIAGTVCALVVVPVLISLVLKNKRVPEKEAWVVRQLNEFYRPALAWAMGHRIAVLGCAFALLLGAGICYMFIGSEFLPKLDEGSLWVRVYLPKSISPTEAAKLSDAIRRRLAAYPEAVHVISQLGRPDDGADINGFDVAEFSVNLKPREEWQSAHSRDELIDVMSRNLAEIPGIETQFSQYIEDNVNEAVSGIKSELALKLYGENPETLQSLADRIADVLRSVPGAKDVGADRVLGQPQFQIEVDRAAIARYGLSVSDVQSVVETAMGGAVATQILEGERTFDLVVKMSPEAVSDEESIRNIPVFGANGEKLTLGALTQVQVRPGLARIVREENARRISIKLSVRGRDLGSLVAEARAKVAAQVLLPPGYRVEWTGAFENQQRAVKRLAVIVPLTMLAILFLLFVAFDSMSLATLILLNVPFGAIGGLCILPVANLALSVSAMVGFVALFGIAVQNGVLLVESIRGLRRRGLEMLPAIIEGAVSRVRPVVMTAAMAALGLLPAAMSRAVGAETSRPFAVVIIGGLFTATLLTLFILPVLYPLFEPKQIEN